MRVLFLTHAFPREESDPVGSFLLRLAVALADEGVRVHVVTPAAPGLAPSDTFHGVTVERFRYAPRNRETLAYTGTMVAQVRGSWGGRAAMAGLLAAGCRTAAAARKRVGAQVLHAHWWFPGGLVGTLVSRFARVPLVTTLHGSDLRAARGAPGGRFLFRRVAHASDRLTAVSNWLAREAKAIAPDVDPVVGPMPVAQELFHPGTSRDPNRLLFVGKLTEQKGLHHLLRALAACRTRPRVDVVGAGRVDDAHLRALADELGVQDLIEWHPLLSQTELADLYRRATAHVIPAIDEGLGLTAVESLLCETPVIAFDSGGVTDAVLHGRTGLLVPPGDPLALAASIDTLLSSSDRGANLGREGRRFALATFGGRAVAARYADLYRSALEDALGGGTGMLGGSGAGR